GNAAVLGKGPGGVGGGGASRLPAAAIDPQPAMLEQSYADARARAAIEADRIRRDVERLSAQTAHAGRDGERELRAGSQPGVGRNCVEHVDPIGALEAQVAPHHLEMAFDAIAFRPGDPVGWRIFDCDARLEIADRNAHAAETTAKLAGEVEEAEMQSRRNVDRYLCGLHGSSFVQTSVPGFLSARVFRDRIPV